MPHIVLKGDIDLVAIFKAITPVFIKSDKGILKTTTNYIDRDNTSILIDSLVIEKGKKQQFMSMIGKRKDGIVIRLYPIFEVEKTDGVKQLLVEIAKQLLGKYSDLRIGETNLSEYL